ncbi:hypothetical protein EYY60_11320 [Flavobacterium zhairuonense]|uniref:hypothetical protein n=1 Tax=Flavobacterium zhairuonense TaxID=2493631 RepID=UPI00104EFF21|nr:hypothetical protein [Flavobacterium zhairuonense]KAF2510095.1 hypothetical protein EYY60_11320 [Flavobacterium zhairuonense]
MIKHLLTFAIIFICSQEIFAQKASDVLENGVPIEKGYRLFLKYDILTKQLKADAASKDQSVDFTVLQDSTIYLVHKNGINIYLRPLNPLNFTNNTEIKIIADPINAAAEKALGSIFENLNGLKTPTESVSSFVIKNKKKIPITKEVECSEFENIKSTIEGIDKTLSESKKEEIIKQFKFLKAITFEEEETTKNQLSSVDKEVQLINDHFNKIKTRLENVQTDVKNYPCTDRDAFTAKYIFNSLIKELQTKLEEQVKRLSNLVEAYNGAKKMQEKASAGGGTPELKWCIHLNEVPSTEGKISIYTITIKEDGLILSDNNEIINTEPKELMKRSIRVRKFQRFVPEVSIGTAYTFYKYYTYGTTSDSTGQQYVGSPTENAVKNLNITTMVNFNYYIPNSTIHPMYQLGIGLNAGIPTLLTGFGLRSNINGLRRFAIAGGLAMTWIKELDTLKVGDKINGTEDIDKDFKYSSVPKFKPYVAIQYNF